MIAVGNPGSGYAHQIEGADASSLPGNVHNTNPDQPNSQDLRMKHVRMDAISIEKNELHIFLTQFHVSIIRS